MSSKKKHGGKPQENINENKQQTSADDSPMQSLGEMLAFAQQTEEMEESRQSVPGEDKPSEPVSDNKAKPDNSVKSSEPAKADGAAKPDNSVKSSEPAKADGAAKPDNSSKSSEPAKADGAAKPDNSVKSSESTKAEKPSGPPITEEERRRREAAEDALDRDLDIARSRKQKEDEYKQRKLDEEKKREAEFLEKAEQAKRRAENARSQAGRTKAATAPMGAPAPVDASDNAQTVAGVVSHGSTPVRKHNGFNNTLMSMAAGRFLAVIVIIAALCYVGAFIYIGSVNEKLFEQLDSRLTGQSRLVTDSSIEYDVPEGSPYTLSEKVSQGLAPGLADSDKDGLSDHYEINVSKTDPKNPDSDGDGLEDGAEVRAELDPLSASSDGDTPDNAILRNAVIADKQVTARITDTPKTAYTSLTRLENNSIQGTPGIVGEAYEFYTNKNFKSCDLTFTYADEELAARNISENALTIVRFDPEKLAFEMIAGQINTESNLVTASITDNGIYALFDRAVLMNKGQTKIFFLIDNSGSMYPEELCPGSEENDVEFKRLDFAVNLMDILGSDVKYGAGQFSGGYAQIAPISADIAGTKKKISDIRDKKQTFSGTEIAGAITGAVAEFGTSTGYDRNYIILLTDGMPSNYNAARESAAVEAAQNANVTIFTIGLGKYIDAGYLYDIAQETRGQFFQASNADALENIYDKISSFMNYNQVTIEEETGRKGYIVADSGFNVVKDGIGYANFRSDFAPNGTDVGIAGLIRAYYRGELAPSAQGYTTAGGRDVPGYDISGVTGFADGKVDLKNVEIGVLKSYNDYNARRDKWNYRSTKGGLLRYTDDTRDFIDGAGMRITTAPASLELPEESGFVNFIRAITFNRIRPFTEYECVLIDSSLCTGDDAMIMDMLEWYSFIPESTGRCRVYDFGYQGDDAFDALFSELSKGSPAVITYGGSAMNAVRVIRDAADPDKYVLDAYDSNSPDRSTRINITRTPLYNEDGSTSFQYTASRGTEEEPLRIIVMN